MDFQLLNPLTNYYEKPETGKEAHKMAVRMENMPHEVSMERTVEIYRVLGVRLQNTGKRYISRFISKRIIRREVMLSEKSGSYRNFCTAGCGRTLCLL